ncbi:TonB-dependent receptor [Flavobacterium pectinovorum]|uniref:Outer membrane receptor proteins, mostly Fe transport n=1 Tax=Flavobacterium pectinovorum TaxID=29533 RepID=A0AB36P852_9FLAO|nr:TonB-dependent receptor [Flavobacterium pectinovorum]OXB07826.1 TonB-dependent receptor [Flavobacterium pectinovorum]SHM81727.1 Outer membrane receptor proteins, mostly Fe transport [Flavobacterium pectinovorum]
MRKSTLKIAPLGLILSFAIASGQETDSLSVKNAVKAATKNDVGIKTVTNSKEENNRNVMLNAANNTSPRDVNIGLPSTVGGITILENDLPVVYFFWPELPNKTWRQSVGLERTGLLKMDQLANTMGDLGFAVNSYSQTGTKDFKLNAKFTTSTFGWLQGDVNVSGPISKNGWTYTAGAFLNYDPSTYKLGFARNVDETNIFRAGATKYFKDDKGKISFLYKYAESYGVNNYALFQYGENGKVTELENFKIGRDSYVVNDGMFKMKDILSGMDYWGKVSGDDNRNTSHNFDILGNYLLDNGWNFKFSTRAHFANARMANIVPLSIINADPSAGYTIASTGQAYSGLVGTQLALHTPKTPVTNIAGRFSLNKQIGDHNLTVGVLEQYYHVDKFTSNRSFFFQTVGAQPQRLIGPGTDADGFYGYNLGGEYHSGTENKISVYGTDEWKVTDDLNLSYGLHLRHHSIDGEFSLTPKTVGFSFTDPSQFNQINKNFFQISGSLNATYNISKNFGVIANFLYTEENRRLESYSQAFDPNTDKIKSPLGAFGVFWNTDYIQLISQATYLKKNNNLDRYNLVNPSNTTQSQNVTVYYDIQTIGWTTDFVLKPFKGFNLHYLLTFQNPVYEKFNFNAFGTDYDYDDNNVLGVAKVLMEIDPSYSIEKWRFWASFRYFSKQYANLTNALYFAPRWETFGGVSYTVNKNINLGATVINFLNQRGASGTINGAELITDASPYYGRLLTGTYIMPLTGQLSVNFNF